MKRRITSSSTVPHRAKLLERLRAFCNRTSRIILGRPLNRHSSVFIDEKLLLKISVYNTVGLLVAIGSPLIIDPRLPSHVLHPNRQYPYTKLWLIALFFLCPVVFVSSYRLLKRKASSKNSVWFSCLPAFIPGFCAAFLLSDERPHSGILVWTFGYCVLTALTVLFRQKREDMSYLNDHNIQFGLKLERLKATITTWQQITVYGSMGYLAFVIFQISVVWFTSKVIVTVPAEQWYFGNFCSGQIALYSFMMIIGPINEAFQMTFSSIRQLTNIKSR